MAKRVNAWYDRKWLMPMLAILTFVAMPFREDIREAVSGLGVTLDDWLFDFPPGGRVNRTGCHARVEKRSGGRGLARTFESSCKRIWRTIGTN